ncbi:MAG: transglycosylase SLT domain-containing protein [Nitrospirae bacterium]|nr:transglycosylase SLT domain-containing protein [Nitrospirota bacterium]
MKRVLCLLIFISLCSPVCAQESDGRAFLKKGKNQLDNGKYEDAIASLSRAEKEFPVLGDYALLWLSYAYHETGNHKESIGTIRTLLNNYPQSPLLRKARSIEIEEAVKVSEEDIEQLFKSYLNDYPKDTEIKYIYAKWLKQKGKTDNAMVIFKDIYIEAGLFSDVAYSELVCSDISVEDMVRRSSNLINKMDYKGAEALLRHAIGEDDGRLKKEILKHLGLALFRQKRYMEAAEVYKEAQERYWEIRSLYRAGKKESVNSVLHELFNMGDRRVSSILVAIAADKRREGNIKDSIDIYQKVMEKYPAEKEDALWGMGWTYFLTGDYKKASEIFTDLYNNYNDTKYLYWSIRSLGENGDDIKKIYPAILEKEVNFYSIMSYARAKSSIEQSDTGAIPDLFKNIMPVKVIQITPRKIDRVEVLLDLGFSNEAISELIYVSKHTNSIEDIYYICSKFKELREYKHSVRLASRAMHIEGLHQFLYPLAYKDNIVNIAGKYGVDPFLVISIIREESRFDPGARSIAGALGLMQLMPVTAHRIDRKLKLGINNSNDILDIKNNLYVGIYYLSNLVTEFGSYTYAIAAYNAGEETVRRWLKSGNYKSVDEFIEDIPYNETRKYVKRVITTFFEYKRLSATGDGLIEIPLEKL